MKIKHIAALVAAASMMAPAAYASKSRLGALEGAGSVDGSVFIKDTRNVFLNPAYVGSFGKNINLELGRGSGTTDHGAEGGFLLSGDSMSYGVQLGRSGFATQNLSAYNSGAFSTFDDSGTVAAVLPQNSVELMVGGAAGWGVGLYYAGSSDDNISQDATGVKNTGDVMTLKGGYATDKMNVFVHYDLTANMVNDERDNGGDEEKLDASGSIRLGGSFMLDDMSSVGGIIQLNNVKSEGTLQQDGSATIARLEYFRKMKDEEMMMAYYKAGILYSASAVKPDGGDEATEDILAIPVTIGMEVKMEEWLVFRGSVNQNVIVDQQVDDSGANDGKRTRNNIGDATVAAGVGMMWGGLRIDSQLAAVIDPVNNGADTGGRIDGDNLLARVGVNYEF
jgi:hypothetical protein